MLALVFVALGLLLLSGVSIYIALAAPAILAMWYTNIPYVAFVQQMFNGINKFALMAIPFFIFAANIMGKGGMSKRIVDLANAIMGRFYGGTAIAAVLACMFFGALSGSSPATVVAIGSLVYPALLEAGYSQRFSMGLVAASSSLAILIPPSITMIVYGSVTGASVGALFLGGIGPGILVGLLFMAYAYWYARKHDIRMKKAFSLREVGHVLRESAWALGVPIIIIGGIYGGVFTPTESATVSAVYAMIIGLFVYRELTWKSLLQVCIDSAVITAQIMILISAAAVLSWVFTVGQLPLLLNQLIGNIETSRILVLLMLNLILVIAGMFLDAAPFILLLAPLFLPIADKVGVSNVHLGIIMSINGALGMFSPPFGLNLFVGMNVFKQDFSPLARSVVPFIFLALIAVILVTFIPMISLWIPFQAYGDSVLK
ncbi:TRAP transporter large permease [Desulfosporosinus burensis]